MAKADAARRTRLGAAYLHIIKAYQIITGNRPNLHPPARAGACGQIDAIAVPHRRARVWAGVATARVRRVPAHPKRLRMPAWVDHYPDIAPQGCVQRELPPFAVGQEFHPGRVRGQRGGYGRGRVCGGSGWRGRDGGRSRAGSGWGCGGRERRRGGWRRRCRVSCRRRGRDRRR